MTEKHSIQSVFTQEINGWRYNTFTRQYNATARLRACSCNRFNVSTYNHKVISSETFCAESACADL
jgi:hypothetical protein